MRNPNPSNPVCQQYLSLEQYYKVIPIKQVREKRIKYKSKENIFA